jgi:tetratricopeptide (TPR) repeat protein
MAGSVPDAPAAGNGGAGAGGGGAEGGGGGFAARDAALALAAGLLGALAFLPVLGHGLVSDDLAIIPADARIRSLANVPSFFAQPLWEAGLPSYRPLLLATITATYALGGAAPAAHHATSLALYALGTAALFGLARALGLARAPAFAAAALFALHPAHGEAVALVYAQAELLAGGLLLASLALHARRPLDADPRRDLRLGAGSAALLLLALFSKETAAAWPALALALDLPRGRLAAPPGAAGPLARLGRIARLLAPFALAAAAYLLVKLLARGSVATAPVSEFASDSALLLHLEPPLGRVLPIVRATAHSLARLLVPAGLATSYDGEAARLAAPGAPADAALLALALAPLALALLSRDPVARGGLLLLLAGLVPSVNPLFVYLTDRGLFLASAGLALAAGAGFAALLARRRGALALVAALLLAPILLVASRVSIAPYADHVSFWARAARRDPEAFRAWRNLAAVLHDAGRPEEADLAAARALSLVPGAPQLLHLRAILALKRGDAEAAAAHASAALRARVPEEGLARYHLGVALLGLERPLEAEPELAAAARLLPSHAPARFYRARALERLGRPEEAAAALEEARGLDPALVERLSDR